MASGKAASGKGSGASTQSASVLDHRFGAGPPLTVGVEEEYMLLSGSTFDLVSGVESVLEEAARERVLRPPEAGADAVRPGIRHRRLRGHRSGARRISEPSAGTPRSARAPATCASASAATHPFSLFENQKITARDRYRMLVEMLQYIARRELVFGMHVHVAVPIARAVPAGDGGRADRAAGAARALVQLAVLAGRGHRPGVDPGDDLRRASHAAACRRGSRATRSTPRPSGSWRRPARSATTRTCGGTSARIPAWARSSCG